MTTGFAVTAGWDLPVEDPSQVHAAVAMADAAVAHAGLSPADRAACALVATELATNLARHARQGRLVATATEPGPAAWVQLAAVDHGPGIPDIGTAMADGYSTTASSLGGGLGACSRAAGAFDLYAAPGAGTVVVARIGPGSSPGSSTGGADGSSPGGADGGAAGLAGVRVGGILSAQPGERESGDAWGVVWGAGTLTVVIMDGLGHGPEAARAAAAGLREVAAQTGRAVPAGADDPVTLLGQMDRQLLGGRGAVAAIARLNGGEIAFGGVGNIGARLGPNGRAHGLVSSMGTLGLGQRLRPGATVTPWRPHSLFTAHTDGIRPGWDLSRYPGATDHDPAVAAALIWRDAATRGDDAAVVMIAPAPQADPAGARS